MSIVPNGLRFWYVLHKWTSLICTLFLLLLCLTGLPLVFHEELAVMLGDLVEPPVRVEPKPVDLDRVIADALARRPADQVKFLMLDLDHPIWQVTMGAHVAAQANSAAFLYDARSGEFIHHRPVNQGLMNVLLKLHVDLLAGLPGTLFLGAMGALFVLSVVSGVVVYGPFMRRLPFGTVRWDGSRRLTWLDLHNLLGIVTVAWAVTVGATGVINTLARPLLAIWQKTELAEMTHAWRSRPPLTSIASVDRAAHTARQAEPNLEIRIIAMPSTPFAGNHHFAFFMRGNTPLTERLLRPVLVDATTLELTASRDMPWYLRLLLVSQPLHFGDYGGMPLKILWAILDLITIAVLMSGLYLWWKKREDPLANEIEQAWSR